MLCQSRAGTRWIRSVRTRVRLAGEQAQGTVELAILVPVLVLSFLGVVDFSRFMYYQQSISSAARTGMDIAINHCSTHVNCGMIDTPTGDDFVIQGVYCDAAPRVILRPAPASCASCMTTICTVGATALCDATCLAGLCTQDICTSPTAASRVNTGSVTVSVGYSFKPITPLIGHFFPDRTCWPDDPASNHHTLCAAATGAVS
jgi:TadE-like protein